MNNEYFEMNQLDASHTLNTDPEAYPMPPSAVGQSTSQEFSNRNIPVPSGTPVQTIPPVQPVANPTVPVQTPAAQNYSVPAKSKSDKELKKVKKKAVILSLLAAAAIVTAGAVMFGVFGSREETFDGNYDLKETAFVTETDSPGIDQISEDVLGTGMLFDDCDILSKPEEGSDAEGRLAGGTDVLIYAAEGDYYKVSDPDKIVVGYVLKEKVNTGNIDLGNPDAESEIIDDATGKVVGTEKTGTSVTSTTVNPEDFPVNSSPYFIYVEKGSHTITIFGKDSNGKYTVPRKTFLTATGRTAALTPVGDFTIKAKEKWHSWGNCYSPYCCKYYGGLFFHGPLYGEKNFGTLSISSVSQIGTNASSGCMRTSVQAAYFIYQFCWVGTNVKIVNGSPLGRSASKPSVASQYVDPATNRVPVAGITFGFDSKTMTAGESLKVSVAFTPSSASEKDCTWSSSNSGVVSVNGNANSCTLKALKEGSAIITACSVDGNYTASFTVKVLPEESSEESSEDSSEVPPVSSDAPSSAESEPSSDDNGSTTETSSQESSATETSASSVTPEDSPVNE